MTCGREETRFGVRRQRISSHYCSKATSAAAQHRVSLRPYSEKVQFRWTLNCQPRWRLRKKIKVPHISAEGIVISHHASRTGIFFPTEVALLRTTFDRICDQRKIGKGSPASDQLAHDLVVLFQGGLLDDFDLTEALRKARAKRFSSAANHVHQNDGLSDTSAT